jgi:hypothetical protein
MVASRTGFPRVSDHVHGVEGDVGELVAQREGHGVTQVSGSTSWPSVLRRVSVHALACAGVSGRVRAVACDAPNRRPACLAGAGE